MSAASCEPDNEFCSVRVLFRAKRKARLISVQVRATASAFIRWVVAGGSVGGKEEGNMQGSSFLRPDPTASSPTRMRLAPLQHSPSANAARVHVPTQSEVNARLGGSFSFEDQY